MTAGPGRRNHFVSEGIAHFRLVGIVAQKLGVLHSWAARAVSKAMIAVEIEIVTLLGPAGRALPVETNQDIVVKFTKVKQRAARASKRVRTCCVLDEHLHHWHR